VAAEPSWWTDTTLHARKERHRHGREGCEADADPARLRVLSAGECADGLDADVGGENEEAQRDQLLGAALGVFGADSCTRKEPEHHEAC
jgi:hypothetical protein